MPMPGEEGTASTTAKVWLEWREQEGEDMRSQHWGAARAHRATYAILMTLTLSLCPSPRSHNLSLPKINK